MPDPTPPTIDPQDPPAPEPDPAPPAPPPADPPADDLPEGAKALIAKLREKEREGEKAAKALADAQAKLAEFEREKMTELERAKVEAEEARRAAEALAAQRREDALKLAVYQQRDALSIASPDLALAALDRGAIEFDADGQPVNVVEQLTALLEREPILKGTPAPKPPPPSDGGRRDTAAPELTADELETARTTGIDPETYAQVKRLQGDRPSIPVMDLIRARFGKQG